MPSTTSCKAAVSLFHWQQPNKRRAGAVNEQLVVLPAADRQLSILAAAGHDNTIRWQTGERLFDLFERRCGTLLQQGRGDHPAIEADGQSISYGALLDRVGRAAKHLSRAGIKANDRVGLLLDRSIDAYIAMLAVVKLEAAYVPLDVNFPADRIAYIAEDAGIGSFITTEAAAQLVAGIDATIIGLEEIGKASECPGPWQLQSPLPSTLRAKASCPAKSADGLAYIIYTSGSTGRPKGVAVNHSSICNFVAVAAAVYGYTGEDRVYQGLTFAFDFSVEEFWVPLMAGATLVASPADFQLVGRGLHDFLVAHRITALCCVPTLLATIEDDVPTLRFLLVSGEACPQDIVARWLKPGRRMLNAYGPTEATVTATWTELKPERKVTIGIPLPTYTIAILNPERPEIVAAGDIGEIAIAGTGLAEGYVNRPDLTATKFIPDFAGLPNNPSRRLYRTGDLGRVNEDGEIEYFGRIDTQVKIKGYRIELSEIEEVLLETQGIAQAVVTVWESRPGRKELAAYYTAFDAAAAPPRADIRERLRDRLPPYMVPAYLEMLDEIPLLPSQKADRNALPAPRHPTLSEVAGTYVPPETTTETVVAAKMAMVLGLKRVSVEDNLFEQLGLDSLRVAEFLSLLNDELAHTKASIADVYLSPTVRQLAAAIDGKQPVSSAERTINKAHRASTYSHAVCGALQGLTYVALYGLYIGLIVVGYLWLSSATSTTELVWRSLAYTFSSLCFLTALPIAAKWALIGRFKPGRIELWSLAYFRFWLVRLLIESSPIANARGSPTINVYLRLLGAKIDSNALILSKSFPLAADLIDIGANAVLRKQCHVTGYRAENGYLRFGSIAIGRDAVVGEGALVDLNTRIGNGAQLGHASALLEGQVIADGTNAHGSPAEPTQSDFGYLPSGPTPLTRRIAYGAAQIAIPTLVTAAILACLIALLSGGLTQPGSVPIALIGFEVLIAWAFGLSAAILVLGYALAFSVHVLGAWILQALLETGKTYPLYGVRYYLAQTLVWLSNSSGFHILFGDSSYIVGYLRLLGIRQPEVRQTGSNFGTSLFQDCPAACEIGSGTMISDGLSLINFEYSASSFRVGRTKVGQESFIGNNIVYPPNSRIGGNCLLASKVMIPTDGELRKDVGLLGSPAFEIPRDVAGRDGFDPVPKTPQGQARLKKKDAYNLRTIALYLVSQWALLFLLFLVLSAGPAASAALGTAGWLLVAGALPVTAILYYLSLEWLTLGGKRMQPYACTIHDPYYAWVERHWKLGEHMLKSAFRGTPFRPVILRWLGVDTGQMVFDDGSVITEKTLVRIGDGACINTDVSIQSHSLEDGLFKSDCIVIGPDCSIGPQAYIHYGTQLGANTIISSDAFIMKGTQTAPFSNWSGNPAEEN